MHRTWKRWISLCLALAMTLSLGAALAGTDTQAGDGAQHGFEVVERSRLDLVNADVTLYKHTKTGALVMYLANGDTNRVFDISFRTPVTSDAGLPHVFEHATLDGSQKYPSKTLFFNLVHQTYNSYINAFTTDLITSYPVASLSEKQLLKYADYYTDSVFNPLLMDDPAIFEEEAWRYAMTDKDAELTIAGTVYTEMQGSYTLDSASSFNFMKTLFPNSRVGNSYGGIPAEIPQMNWESLKEYHDAYYHPSNSFTCLYGAFEDAGAFLELLDGYFSAYEHKKFDLSDAAYTPLTEYTEKRFVYPVEAGSDINNRSSVYYGIVLKDGTDKDNEVLDLLTTLLNEPSSWYQQTVKERLPSATASCYIDLAAPQTALIFTARGINAEDAPAFRAIADETLVKVRDEGLDLQAVEAVAARTRLDLLLSTESSSVGVNILPSIAYLWAAGGDPNAYAKFVDYTANYLPYAQDGTYQEVVSRLLEDTSASAMTITEPEPGLKEKEDEALKAELAERKAAMGAAEIEAIVAATAAAGQEEADDSAQYVQQLQAVTVDSLPEERRMYDVIEETGADNVVRLTAQADVSQVGQALLLLDASAIPQEDLHWFKLYVDLLGKLDTDKRGNAELSAMITRYLYSPTMRVSTLSGADGQQLKPKLRLNWIAMDEDMQAAYDLVHEILFEAKLNDVKAVTDRVSQVKTSLKQTITDASYNILAYRAFASGSPAFKYFNYVNFLDYYTFLEGAELLLAENPDAAVAKLEAVEGMLNNRTGAVSGFAGSADSAAHHRGIADDFLSKLHAAATEPVTYDLPAIAPREALVVDSNVQYNLLYAPYEALGRDGFTGDLDAVSRYVSDAFLYPQLRDQYGAYGVDHTATEEGVYILSYRDPNVQETFDVYKNLPQQIRERAVDQDTLDGYILSAYNLYAASTGELAGGLAALMDHVDGRDPQRYMEWMRQLKHMKADQVQAYADLYEKLYAVGYTATAGGAAKVEANKALYEQVYNPFQVTDAPKAALSDVNEGDPYYDAVLFVRDNGLMQPKDETSFGVNDPATIGEYAQGMFLLVGGGAASAEDSVAALSGAGLLTPGAAADSPLLRGELAQMVKSVLAMSGMDMTADLPELPELTDADQIAAADVDMYRFLIGSDFFPLRDGAVAAGEPMTRGELAHVLAALGR